MLPADEGLDPDDLAGAHVDLRLIVEDELIGLQRERQLLRHGEPVASLGSMHRVIYLDAGAVGLGGIHGDVRALDEAVGRVGMQRVQGHADAAGDLLRDVVERERREQGLAQSVGDAHGQCLVGTAQHETEPVAAETSEHVHRRAERAPASTDLAEQPFADVVTEEVVTSLNRSRSMSNNASLHRICSSQSRLEQCRQGPTICRS